MMMKKQKKMKDRHEGLGLKNLHTILLVSLFSLLSACGAAGVGIDDVLDPEEASLTIVSPNNNSNVEGSNVDFSVDCNIGSMLSFEGDIETQSDLECAQSPQSFSLQLNSGLGEKNITITSTNSETSILKEISINAIELEEQTFDLGITVPSQDEEFSSATVLVTGSCETGADVLVSGNIDTDQTTACSDALFSTSIELENIDGEKNITVSQTHPDKGSQSATVRVSLSLAVVPDDLVSRSNAIIKNYCADCHIPGYQYGDLSSLETDEDWINTGFIVEGSPDDSLLIQKLKNFGGALSSMPPIGQLNDDEYATLRERIIDIEKIDIPDNIEQVSESDNDLLMSGLDLFLAQMQTLYKNDNDLVDHVFAQIKTSMVEVWGGECDFYRSAIETSSGGSSNSYFQRPASLCGQFDKDFNSSLGAQSVIKAGTRINICEYMVNSSQHTFAFKSNYLQNDQTFNQTNAETIFHLYYPGLEFEDDIYNGFVSSLESNGGSSLNDDEKWKVYLSTLCQSLYWEIH